MAIESTAFLTQFDNQELVALAKLDLDQGKIDQALLKIKCALSADKGDIEALSIAGKLYAQLKLFDKAKNCFKQYLEINPNSVVEKFQYGMVHFDAGENDIALSLWNELLEKLPTHPPALFYKGLMQAQSGAVADARNTLSILLQSAPADNLYFGRAKELLQALDNNGKAPLSRDSDEQSTDAILPKDAYKVIN